MQMNRAAAAEMQNATTRRKQRGEMKGEHADGMCLAIRARYIRRGVIYTDKLIIRSACT